MSDVILITGATGFIGGHILRKALEKGFRPRILVRPTSRYEHLKALPIEVVEGDLTEPESLEPALQGCRWVFHCAADYRFDPPDPFPMYRANVEGTRHLLEAAEKVGVERIVYTSTVGALGLYPKGTPANENTPLRLRDLVSHYKRSKYQAEQEALRAAARGVPIVIVNPSTPVGPGDVKPTPTGQIIVDFLNGKMFAYVDTGLNLVPVEDVAEGHFLAAERGRVGERYILGGQNFSFREFLGILALLTGRPAPKLRLPLQVVLFTAYGERLLRLLIGGTPRIPLEGVKTARKKMYFDSSKAQRELGFQAGNIESALMRAIHWFEEHGFVQKPLTWVKNKEKTNASLLSQ